MSKACQLLLQWLLLFSLCVPAGLWAQRTTISGTVTSAADGAPLSKVTVELEGSSRSTQTDKDGQYRIEVERSFFTPAPDQILVFSKKGFEAQTLNATGKQKLDVRLRPEGALETADFRTGPAAPLKPVLLPFAAYQIEKAAFERMPPDRLSSVLAARVPGLRLLEPGGQPGQEAYFQLRANNALSGSQQPLLMVDGIYLGDASLIDLNPENVDRVEVLTGTAGAARYGSQGGQGVIQVFTKDGRQLGSGETHVTYRTTYGFTEASNQLPTTDFTNREVIDPTGPQPILGSSNASDTYTTPLPNLQDYQDTYLFERGELRSNSLTVSGRSGGTHFLGTAERLRDEGALPGNQGYTRNTFRANLGHQAGDNFRAYGKLLYTDTKQDALPVQSGRADNRIASNLLLSPIFDLEANNEEDGSAFDWDIDNTGNRITNPLYLREQIDQQTRRNRLLGTFGGSYAFTGWLDFDYRTGLDRATQEEETFVEKGYLSTTLPTGFGPMLTAGVDESGGGGFSISRNTVQYFTSEASLRAHRSFVGFRLNARAGLLYENYQQDFTLNAGENLAVSGIRSLDNLQSNIRTSSRRSEMTTYSGFLLADADYRQKFIFSGAVRAEQSTLFGDDVDWPGFYRVAAAYRLSEDVNMKFFQELKLRAATGRAGIRPAYDQRFETYRLINGRLSRQTLGNDRLQPTLVQDLEVGIDATFLRAFTLSGTYTQTEASDQIVFAPLSGGTGFEGQWRNAGTVEADVYEASLHIDFKKLFRLPNPKIRWGVRATGQRVEQRVAALGVPAYTTGPGLRNSDLFRITEGQPLGVMVGEVFASSVEELAEQPDINLLEYTTNELGYIVRADQLGTPEERPVKLMDENGSPVQRVIGNVNPDFQIGIAHTFAFRGFELFALFDWRKGGDVYNFTRQWMYQNGRHADLSQSSGIAAGFFGNDGLSNNLVPNAHFVEDGSYFMLREAAISLTLDRKQLPFFGNALEQLRISFAGRNLFTQTDYSGFHPALSSGLNQRQFSGREQAGSLGSNRYTPGGNPALFAVDAFNYPLRKSYSLSFQITL
ncbi:MAG: TonB-dependent receptor [Bacteroidetes bacterium]|jgi:TonB-linked SusC/RagA family outer membrane protein|nr:TonB-dependent receptor [Bacteroidota bacterium]